jgi:hypothetical protein
VTTGLRIAKAPPAELEIAGIVIVLRGVRLPSSSAASAM